MRSLVIVVMSTLLQGVVIHNVKDQVNPKANHKAKVTRLFIRMTMTD